MEFALDIQWVINYGSGYQMEETKMFPCNRRQYVSNKFDWERESVSFTILHNESSSPRIENAQLKHQFNDPDFIDLII